MTQTDRSWKENIPRHTSQFSL